MDRKKRRLRKSNGRRKSAANLLAKLYQVFVANKFDTIKGDERGEITYDSASEGIVINLNERDSFQKGSGKNSPLSGGNLRRYGTVRQAIFDLAAKYAGEIKK
jgi:hypothetical protein